MHQRSHRRDHLSHDRNSCRACRYRFQLFENSWCFAQDLRAHQAHLCFDFRDRSGFDHGSGSGIRRLLCHRHLCLRLYFPVTPVIFVSCLPRRAARFCQFWWYLLSFLPRPAWLDNLLHRSLLRSRHRVGRGLVESLRVIFCTSCRPRRPVRLLIAGPQPLPNPPKDRPKHQRSRARNFWHQELCESSFGGSFLRPRLLVRLPRLGCWRRWPSQSVARCLPIRVEDSSSSDGSTSTTGAWIPLCPSCRLLSMLGNSGTSTFHADLLRLCWAEPTVRSALRCRNDSLPEHSHSVDCRVLPA